MSDHDHVKFEGGDLKCLEFLKFLKFTKLLIFGKFWILAEVTVMLNDASRKILVMYVVYQVFWHLFHFESSYSYWDTLRDEIRDGSIGVDKFMLISGLTRCYGQTTNSMMIGYISQLSTAATGKLPKFGVTGLTLYGCDHWHNWHLSFARNT